MDVASAYTYGKLSGEMYMEPPELPNENNSNSLKT